MQNPEDYSSELDELCINTAIDILFERAEAGDEEAFRTLKKLSDDGTQALAEIERQKQSQEGLNA